MKIIHRMLKKYKTFQEDHIPQVKTPERVINRVPDFQDSGSDNSQKEKARRDNLAKEQQLQKA